MCVSFRLVVPHALFPNCWRRKGILSLRCCRLIDKFEAFWCLIISWTICRILYKSIQLWLQTRILVCSSTSRNLLSWCIYWLSVYFCWRSPLLSSVGKRNWSQRTIKFCDGVASVWKDRRKISLMNRDKDFVDERKLTRGWEQMNNKKRLSHLPSSFVLSSYRKCPKVLIKETSKRFIFSRKNDFYFEKVWHLFEPLMKTLVQATGTISVSWSKMLPPSVAWHGVSRMFIASYYRKTRLCSRSIVVLMPCPTGTLGCTEIQGSFLHSSPPSVTYLSFCWLLLTFTDPIRFEPGISSLGFMYKLSVVAFSVVHPFFCLLFTPTSSNLYLSLSVYQRIPLCIILIFWYYKLCCIVKNNALARLWREPVFLNVSSTVV
jgi:hypothetical protein